MADKLGIVAGSGQLPADIAGLCRAADRDYFIVAIKGHADPELIADSPHQWIRLGEGGRGIDLFHENDVRDIVFAGAVRRPSLLELRPDGRTAKFFARLGKAWIGDDSLLSALVKELEGDGFRVVAPESLLQDGLAIEGAYGRHRPEEQAVADIDRGFSILCALAAQDVGQSVVIQQGIVLGVEAAEGTDELVRRCGPLHREGTRGVLVKAHKTGQERRVDLPVVGAVTMRAAIEAGLMGIAVEAEGTLVFERNEMVRLADEAGLFLVGVRAPDGG
jgi:UDP-2,3-diacylglucosamine hydrolase